MASGNTGFGWGYSLPITGGTAALNITEAYTGNYTSPWTGTIPGTATNAFDVAYSEVGSLVATSKTFTLSALPGVNGGTAKVIAHLKEVIIMNTAAIGSGFNLTLSQGATNPCILLAGSAGSVVIPPQGVFALAAPGVAGLGAVVASTSDKIKIDAGANTVGYEIQIKGISI